MAKYRRSVTQAGTSRPPYRSFGHGATPSSHEQDAEGEATAEARSDDKSLPWWSALPLSRLESWTVLLTLGGFVVYAIVRYGQLGYADALDLDPESDLGLSYSRSLSGAAALAAAFAVTILFAVVAFWAFASLGTVFRRLLSRASSPSTRFAFKASGKAVLGSLVGCVYVLVLLTLGFVAAVFAVEYVPAFINGYLFPHLNWTADNNWVNYSLLFGTPIVAWLLAHPRLSRREAGERHMQITHSPLRTLVVPVSLALFLSVAAREEGKAAAADVLNGKSTWSSLYGIRAIPVSVKGSLPRGFTPPVRLMLLAVTDTRITLYDPDGHRVIMLPAGGILIQHKLTG